MQKILFCNLDLLVKSFAGWNPEFTLNNRNEFLGYISILCRDNNNIVCFISRDQNKLDIAKEYFNQKGYNAFKYKSINEQITKIAQNHPAIVKTSSSEAPCWISR